MKNIYLVFVLALIICAGCKKNNNTAVSTPAPVPPVAIVKTFDVFYDGKEYTGGVNYNGIPVQNAPPGKYKNVVAGFQIQDVNFSLVVTNIPDSGITQNLCSSGCDPKNGDTNLIFTDTEINLAEFTGTVQRVSSGKILLNASKAGKTLVGSLQWK